MLKLAEWAVGDLLNARGYRTAFFSGAESQKSRTQNVVEFHVERTAGGGLKIEAEPEAAGTLAAMFQGMADLLMKAAQGE